MARSAKKAATSGDNPAAEGEPGKTAAKSSAKPKTSAKSAKAAAQKKSDGAGRAAAKPATAPKSKPAAKPRSATAAKSNAKANTPAKAAPAAKTRAASKSASSAASGDAAPPSKSRSAAKSASARAAKAAVSPVRKLDDLRKAVAAWRSKGESVALVPTMGALHEGHLSLCRLAARKAQHVVVSVFVNPAQFAPGEDLERYPRDEAADLGKLKGTGAELVWLPTPDLMYGEGFATQVVPDGAARGLEADVRPHFFAGVATVCCKLFNQVQPDVAVFGEKDYQQLCVVRQMARDLDLPLKIVGGPTQREDDGLALSSRNTYLTDKEREIAPRLHESLHTFAQQVLEGVTPGVARAEVRMRLIMAGFRSVDYIEVRDAETLAAYERDGGRSGRVLGAARLGDTRLIDNIPLR